jgi:predicted PurR-regulated permease PerM
MAGLLSGVVMLFAPLVAEQLAALRGLNPDDLIRHWNDALATVDRWTAGIDMSGEGIANSAFLAEEASQWIQMETAGSFLTDLLSSIGNVFVATFSILFMAFFFLQEPHLFKHFVLGLTPPDKQASAEKVMARSGELLTRYFGGLVIQVSIVTLIGLDPCRGAPRLAAWAFGRAVQFDPIRGATFGSRHRIVGHDFKWGGAG